MITEVHMNQGSWDLELKWVASSLWNTLDPFGHVVVLDKSFVVGGKTDAQILAASKYTGILMRKARGSGGWAIGGHGLESWLGEGSEFGDVLIPPVVEGTNTFNGVTFSSVLTALLPPALAVGTSPGIDSTSITALYYNEHIWQTRQYAIRYVLDAYSAIEDLEIEYRVDHDGTFHAAKRDLLYVTTPVVTLVRRAANAPELLSLGKETFSMGVDATRYATKVVLQGSGAGYTLLTGEADLTDLSLSNPYKDLQGNALNRIKVVSEAETPQFSANPNYLPDNRALLHLIDSQEMGERISLSSREWEIDPDTIRPGDWVNVYDDTDDYWEDLGNPVSYKGGTIYPVTKRVFRMTWPVHLGKYQVWYRDANATYTDLTGSLVNEDDQRVAVEVGTATRKLAFDPSLLKNVLLNRATSGGDETDPGGIVDKDGNQTIPGQVTWANTPWGYNLWYTETGQPMIEVLVQWNEPNNTNGDPILDGDRYEINYKQSTQGTWEAGLIVSWGETTRLISGLPASPSAGFLWDFRIRAVDTSGNAGAWSVVESISTPDTTPPSKPAVPTIVPMPLAFQLSHDLDTQGVGYQRLEPDTAQIKFYASLTNGFTPDDATNLVGAAPVNPATTNVTVYADLPDWATQTVYVRCIAVDWVGNESQASNQVSDVVPQILATQLADDAIDQAKVAPGLVFIQIVTSFPGSPTNDDIVYLTTAHDPGDGGGTRQPGLWRYNSTSAMWEPGPGEDSITAGTIAAGAVGADEIAANSVYVKQLVVANFDNLLSNPGWEIDVVNGPLDPHEYDDGTGGTWSSATVDVRTGARAGRFDVDSQTATARIVFNGPSAEGVSANTVYRTEVAEGDQFALWGYARYETTAPTTNPILRMTWLDESGTFVADNSVTISGLTTSYQQYKLQATAPAGAVYVEFRIIIPFGANASTVAFLFDDFYARQVLNGQLIVDGTIEAAKLSALTIEVGKHIQSSNFVVDTSGWRIDGAGLLEAHNIKIRGNVIGDLVLDGSGSFKSKSSGARLEITQSAADRIRMYNASGVNKVSIGTALGITGATGDDLQITAANDIWIDVGVRVYLLVKGSAQPSIDLDAANLGAGQSYFNMTAQALDFQFTRSDAAGFNSAQVLVNPNYAQTAPIRPQFSFIGDRDTGILYNAANSFDLVQNSTSRLRVGANLTVLGSATSLRLQDGSVSAPALARNAQTNTGLYFPTTSQIALSVAGVQEFLLGVSGLNVPNVYSFTATARNVNVNSNGALGTTSSSRRFKRHIRVMKLDQSILTLKPRTFEVASSMVVNKKTGKQKKIWNDTWGAYFIAEEVAEILPEAIHYDQWGRIEDINDRVLLAALFLEVKENRKRLDKIQHGPKTI